jgi:hypothetical protein
MELHSTPFARHIQELMEDSATNRNCRLVGAMTAPRCGHRVAFCDEISAMSGVEVHNLTKKTRRDVVECLLQSMEDRGWLQ